MASRRSAITFSTPGRAGHAIRLAHIMRDIAPARGRRHARLDADSAGHISLITPRRCRTPARKLRRRALLRRKVTKAAGSARQHGTNSLRNSSACYRRDSRHFGAFLDFGLSG